LFLGLAENRFDDRLPPLVNCSPCLGAQFVGHGLLGRGIFRWRSARRLDHFFVLDASGGHIQINFFYGLICNISLAPVTGIGADGTWLATHVGLYLL
jgi:hypothetical protein